MNLPFVAGYPYFPQALRSAPQALDQAERFHLLLKNGALHEVRGAIADRPELLAELLPIVGNPEAAMNVRLGASVIFEEHAGGPALRAVLPQLGRLSAHADARVRADACFYLGLAADDAARAYLLPRLQDADAEVREIAADALAGLGASAE
ncbi:MAG TPA: HEAT repeat domain-containing protein [Rhodocyclaceae bacterium]